MGGGCLSFAFFPQIRIFSYVLCFSNDLMHSGGKVLAKKQGPLTFFRIFIGGRSLRRLSNRFQNTSVSRLIDFMKGNVVIVKRNMFILDKDSELFRRPEANLCQF